jgi:hypothetical protein
MNPYLTAYKPLQKRQQLRSQLFAAVQVPVHPACKDSKAV